MDNPNRSPELHWSGVPAGAKSFALTLTDVTFGQPHWAIWNIPADLTTLPGDIPKDSILPGIPVGAVQSSATFNAEDGYLGPQAPCNVYQFELFALSVETFTPTKPDFVTLVRTELEGAGDLLLGRATLTARNNYMSMCE